MSITKVHREAFKRATVGSAAEKNQCMLSKKNIDLIIFNFTIFPRLHQNFFQLLFPESSSRLFESTFWFLSSASRFPHIFRIGKFIFFTAPLILAFVDEWRAIKLFPGRCVLPSDSINLSSIQSGSRHGSFDGSSSRLVARSTTYFCGKRHFIRQASRTWRGITFASSFATKWSFKIFLFNPTCIISGIRNNLWSDMSTQTIERFIPQTSPIT